MDDGSVLVAIVVGLAIQYLLIKLAVTDAILTADRKRRQLDGPKP
ncbi:hypothetical protein [Jiangella alkaliphila]|uniref:Uncharacterized protein n=1 Tax=Jiangella alkaliphila TaxID=419479 RepID=A0A1H2IFQ5_9ACTN|nr:hypothetical protein [Jiangella alkaliphila]SDU42924.1 hypothetical protein SAMN04488563_1680 [Jiangella alkaliphila]